MRGRPNKAPKQDRAWSISPSRLFGRSFFEATELSDLESRG